MNSKIFTRYRALTRHVSLHLDVYVRTYIYTCAGTTCTCMWERELTLTLFTPVHNLAYVTKIALP
jgi:hypothetical protein